MKHLHLNVIVRGMAQQQMRQIQTNFDNLKELIMATAQEANAKLDAMGASLDKISGETTGLVQEVADLKTAAQNAGSNVPDDVMAKIDSLMSKAQSIDAQVDDVAPNPTPTPEPTDTSGGTTDTGGGSTATPAGGTSGA